MSGICTCSISAVERYPAILVLEYLVTRSLGGVRRVSAGTKEIVKILSEECEVKLNSPVRSISVEPSGKLRVSCDDSSELFDQVIIATQAPQAAKILSAGSSKESVPELIKLLKTIQSERSEVIVHGDSNLMPRNRSDWRSVNFLLKQKGKHKETMATIWMNRAQTNFFPTSRGEIFQSWNPLFEPREELVFHRANFDRPIVTPDSLASVNKIIEINGKSNIWVCGSYSDNAIPLLEAGVSSATRVVQRLGVRIPWSVEKRRIEPPSNFLYKIFFIFVFLFTVIRVL